METAEADTSQIDAYVQAHGFIGQFDTSAKTNINIDKAMLTIVDRILDEKDVMQRLETIKVT